MAYIKLRAKIMERGYTIKSLSAALGMSGNALYRKVNGKTEFKLSDVLKICDKLKITSGDEVREIFFSHSIP